MPFRRRSRASARSLQEIRQDIALIESYIADTTGCIRSLLAKFLRQDKAVLRRAQTRADKKKGSL